MPSEDDLLFGGAHWQANEIALGTPGVASCLRLPGHKKQAQEHARAPHTAALGALGVLLKQHGQLRTAASDANGCSG